MDADVNLFESNSPAARLLNNADDIRSSGLAIYLECGDNDALNLHDGTEFLHRVLWDLDISHEYHLVKDADHVGPSIAARLHEAIHFLSNALQNPRGVETNADLSESGKAWMAWAESGMQGEGPDFDLMSEEGVSVLRAQFAPVRSVIAEVDPTINRRYAVLPPSKD